MKQKLLSENIISSLGRTLQAIYPEHFTESWLNKILRLLFDNLNRDNSLKKNFPDDVMIFTYSIEVFSINSREDYIEYKNALESKYKSYEYVIMLELLPAELNKAKFEAQVDTNKFYKFLELLIFYLKNGIKILKVDKLLIQNEAFNGISTSEIVVKLVTDIVHTIDPKIFIFTNNRQCRNDKCLKRSPGL